MKNSKWISAVGILALSATLAVAGPTMGDGNGGGRHRHHRGEIGKQLAETLNLTDDQKAQIKAINKSFRTENAAFLETTRQTREELHAAKKAGDTAKADALKATLTSQRAQLEQLEKAKMAKVTSVLTADQQAQWQQMKEQMKARRAEHQQQKSESK